MPHDLVIRGGTVVDGTGAPARGADVAVDGDRITRVGDVDASGAGRVIDADGAIVTPGFVDIHSHLDAQIGWDPTMSSSCWHGVTSVVMGNCGMTFAPVREGQAELLARAMESVEDIPASCILEGLPWNWESFGGYLDAIEALPGASTRVPTSATSRFACTSPGTPPASPTSKPAPSSSSRWPPACEAMEAGALGYSISRSLFHRVPDGRNVPGTWSDPEEFFAIAAPLGELGRRVLESAPRYNEEHTNESRVVEELSWMAELSRRTGRPFCFNLQQISSLGEHYRQVMELAAEASADGASLRPQMTPRSVGVLFSLAANTLIDDLPSFAPLREADLQQRLAALRDPEMRQRLVAEGATKDRDPFTRMYLMPAGEPARYTYDESDSIAAIADARGVSPVEAYIDAMVESGGRSIVNWPVMNQDESAIEELITNPVTIMGLADAGAHATQIMDASQPTYFLSHWVRDEGLLGLEEGVRALTQDTAEFIGYADRGTVTEGAFADLNVIDLDQLSLPLPEITHDFPGGVPRFVQRAEGMLHTIVNGVPFMEDGVHTGATPGRILRSTDA
ncbi:MAG: amidohydrolase family protein [Microthrixaceae bacterium]